MTTGTTNAPDYECSESLPMAEENDETGQVQRVDAKCILRTGHSGLHQTTRQYREKGTDLVRIQAIQWQARTQKRAY
jgi:hypothetical protein